MALSVRTCWHLPSFPPWLGLARLDAGVGGAWSGSLYLTWQSGVVPVRVLTVPLRCDKLLKQCRSGDHVRLPQVMTDISA